MRRVLLSVGMLLLTSTGVVRAQEQPEEPGGGIIPAGGFGQRPLPSRYAPPIPDVVVDPSVLEAQTQPQPQPKQPVPPPVPPPPLQPPLPGTDPLADRFASAFATQTGQGGLQGRSINEEFDGDNAGMFYRLRIITGTTFETRQVGTRQVTIIDPQTEEPRTITVPIFRNFPVTNTATVRVPVAGRYSGVQVTDNDSPRPSDRVYFGHSYYDGLAGSLNSAIGAFQLNRSMIGFEKTLLDGSASVGMRLPFHQLTGPAGLGGDGVGDLTVLLKYAAYYDPLNNNYFTLGFAVTSPTGAPGGVLADGTSIPHSVLLQPWVGFIRSGQRAYIQGISNLIIPTDDRDITLLGNSIGFGYWLYRGNFDRLFPAITPTAEFHIRTPLSNRGPDSLVYFPDQVNITSGIHFRWPRLSVSAAVSVPVVGPRPWDIEALSYINFRF